MNITTIYEMYHFVFGIKQASRGSIAVTKLRIDFCILHLQEMYQPNFCVQLQKSSERFNIFFCADDVCSEICKHPPDRNQPFTFIHHPPSPVTAVAGSLQVFFISNSILCSYKSFHSLRIKIPVCIKNNME